MNNDDRIEIIVVDVTGVQTSKELHLILKKKLSFPEFYGMNWNAFWDAITGLIEMPKKLVIHGWHSLYKSLPDDAKIMRKMLCEFNEEYPTWKCNVEYK